MVVLWLALMPHITDDNLKPLIPLLSHPHTCLLRNCIYIVIFSVSIHCSLLLSVLLTQTFSRVESLIISYLSYIYALDDLTQSHSSKYHQYAIPTFIYLVQNFFLSSKFLNSNFLFHICLWIWNSHDKINMSKTECMALYSTFFQTYSFYKSVHLSWW
jgi:hypothetical protein